MPEIVAIGECLVELYSDEPIGVASQFHRAFAGDTCNAVLMASRLGLSCGYVTRMGDDPFADYLLAELRKAGVDTSRVKRVDGFNGVHFISLLPDGDREFVYYRSGSAASTMTPDDLDAAYIGSAGVLHLSAILQATSPSARSTVIEAAKMARRLGVTVSYDTNLRLNLWPVEEARAALEDILPHVDIVFVSHPSETGSLLGVDSELAALELLLDRGVGVAAVKCGADGSWVATPDRVARVEAIAPAGVSDTTGAGDAFAAGVMLGIVRGWGPFEGARWGAASAGLKVGARGAVVSQPSLEDVEKVVGTVGLTWL